jgi:hypothetical protein
VLHFGPMRRPGTSLVVVAAVVAAAFSGCGGDDNGGSDGDQPLTARETAHAFVAAQNAGDFARVCELFGDPLRQQLGGDDCVNFLKGQTSGAPLHTYRLITVGASGDQATAYIVTQGANGKLAKLSLELARRDDQWKIVGSGPTAPRGIPVPD